jgi:hypothetical protein
MNFKIIYINPLNFINYLAWPTAPKYKAHLTKALQNHLEFDDVVTIRIYIRIH